MKTFKSAAQFRQWLMKNHVSATELFIKFYKKNAHSDTLTMAEAAEQALCFGWTCNIIKRVDDESYSGRFSKRRPGGIWSTKVIQAAESLKKRKLMHSSGLKTFNSRDKKRSLESIAVFSTAYLKIFKSNEKAWDFFNRQTPGYKKYMAFWVMEAKREETRQKRLNMLIEDSAQESKLKRTIEAQKKYSAKSQPNYEPGKTPIEAAKNIGPVVGSELRSIGIHTKEQLQEKGWEKVFYRLCELYPHRINLNCISALIGAVEEQSWKKLDPELKNQGKAVLREMKIEIR